MKLPIEKYLYQILLLCCLVLPVQAIGGAADTLLLRMYDNPMHHLYQLREKHEEDSSRYLFNSDTLFYRYATNGYASLNDELYYYYHDYVSAMPLEEAEREVERMREAARRYNSKPLANEADLMKVQVLNYYEDSLLQVCNEIVRAVAARAGKEGDYVSMIRAMNFDFISNYRTKHYAYAFNFAPRVVEELNKLTDEQYSERREMFYHLGRAYMDFRDYPRALDYLREALVDTTRYFFDRSNIRARVELGNYYRTVNQLDSSDYYFRSIITSRDIVKFRPYYDYQALVNLGYNLYLRKSYDEAAAYYEYARDFSRKGDYHALSATIFTGLGEIGLEKKNLPQVKAMIDSAYTYIHKGKLSPSHAIWLRLYPLLSRYYSMTGETNLSDAYFDSTLQINRQQEERFNALHILRAEQALFQAEEATRMEQLTNQRSVIRFALLALAILTIAVILLVRLYYRKREAYRQLVIRSREWADSVRIFPAEKNKADIEDTAVMEVVRRLIEEQQAYRDPTLTLESLARLAGYGRNVVSKAINSTQQKTFNTFINDYRIKETIRILTDPANDNLHIEHICDEAGFNSKETFYRAFRTQTGMTPLQFRKNRNI